MIKPTGKYVLLDVNKQENTSPIHIPTQYIKKERKGRIIALGDHISIPINIGDTIHFNSGGIKPTEDGELLHERNINGIIYGLDKNTR